MITDMDVFYKDEKTATVHVDDKGVHIKRYILHPVKQIFCKDEMTKFEFGEVLRLRCWDEHRTNLDKYLKKMGLDSFDIYKICEKTHGMMLSDYIWFRFPGETITAKDILVKK